MMKRRSTGSFPAIVRTAIILLFVMMVSIIPTGRGISAVGATHESTLKLMKERLPDAKFTEVDEGLVHGVLIEPKEKLHDGIILAVSGSDGTYDYDYGVTLPNEGYTVFLISFFNKPGLPDDIIHVPVDEIMDEVFKYMDSKKLDYEPLTFVGTSRGSEFAQIVANNYKQVDNIILKAPFSYAMPYFYFEGGTEAPWLFKGEPIPYWDVDVDKELLLEAFKVKETPGATFELIRLYDEMFSKFDENPPEQMDLSNFKGKILLFAGDDDRLAPTARMAKVIAEKYTKQSELHIFKGAGHAFFKDKVLGSYINGGSEKANEDAYYESMQLLFDFLEDYHK